MPAFLQRGDDGLVFTDGDAQIEFRNRNLKAVAAGFYLAVEILLMQPLRAETASLSRFVNHAIKPSGPQTYRWPAAA